jgi:aldehyde dehydrogenase (NAD+)
MEMIAEKTDTETIDRIFGAQQKKALEMRQEAILERKKRLQKLRSWLLENRTAIQNAIYRDFKKPAGEVDGAEIFHLLSEIKLALAKLDQWAAAKKVDAPITFLGTRSYLRAEPRGVCLIISPWNYPLSLAVGPLISALAAGNTAMVKPSEVTPHTARLIATMAAELFDESVVSVLDGDAEVSKYLTSLPFDHIFFTGSPSIGKSVMKAAAENLTSVTLELGGKSPAFVTSTARIEEAAERIAFGKFLNAGQTCIATDYVLVDEKIADRLVKALKEKTVKLFAEKGQALRDSKHYTRMVSGKHWLRMNALLQDAVTSGATLEMGGEVDEDDRFFHPTILTNVAYNSRILEEEIFGPILPVITYSSLKDALKMVNTHAKPLALYIFSQSQHEQQQIEQATSSGAVCINDTAIHFLNNHLPFGGVNNSGTGSTHGHYGFLAFSHLKPVLKQRNGFTSISAMRPPYTKSVQRLMDWLFKMF